MQRFENSRIRKGLVSLLCSGAISAPIFFGNGCAELGSSVSDFLNTPIDGPGSPGFMQRPRAVSSNEENRLLAQYDAPVYSVGDLIESVSVPQNTAQQHLNEASDARIIGNVLGIFGGLAGMQGDAGREFLFDSASTISQGYSQSEQSRAVVGAIENQRGVNGYSKYRQKAMPPIIKTGIGKLLEVDGEYGMFLVIKGSPTDANNDGKYDIYELMPYLSPFIEVGGRREIGYMPTGGARGKHKWHRVLLDNKGRKVFENNGETESVVVTNQGLSRENTQMTIVFSDPAYEEKIFGIVQIGLAGNPNAN